MRYGLVLCFVLLASWISSPASFAVSQSIEKLMHERHEKFERMGEAFEEIDREAKRNSPDVALIRKHAEQISIWAHEQVNWFPPGSGPDSGIDTEAKAEIWSQPEDFKSLQDEFIVEADKLKDVVAADSIDGIQHQVEAVGQVCSQCHETYRKQFSLFSIFGF